MIVFDKNEKKLVIPSALGNFGSGGGSGSGMTPDEVQEMIDTSIEEYDVEIQVDLEDIRDAVSANTEDIAALSGATSGMSSDISALSASTVGIAAGLEAISGSMKETFYFDVASYFAMGYEDRRNYWDMVYAKVNQGAQVYAIGASDYASSMTAIIPLVKYKAETDPSTHAGGWLYFSAKAPMYNNDTNLYFSFAASSVGDINGLNASGQFVSQSVYNLPVASDSTLGGVKVGSGLAVDANGVLSVSASTQDLENLSAATVSIRSDVNTLSGDTDNIKSDVNNLSAATSGVASDIVALSGATVGIEGNLNAVSGAAQETYDAIFYEDEGETYSQIDDLWGALGDKQDVLEISSGLTIDDNVLKVNKGHALTFSAGGKLEVKFGKGVQYDGNDALELNIGEGLGFSGDTLVVSGISGGDGWQWISEDEYDSWTSAEKEAWYDNILDECWNNDNFKFGVYQVSDKTSSADTGYDQMSVAYRTMVLNNIEAGYNSLHFSGAEFGAGDKNISEWSARIQRGGNWEVWTSSSSFELHASTFSLTSAGTAYGYFDSYNFNRCFDYAQTPGSYYAPAFNPILIYDGTPDTDPIGVGNVRLLAKMTDGTVEGGQDINKAVIEFGVPGGDFYRAIGYSVGQNQEGYDVRGWHLISCTQITF